MTRQLDIERILDGFLAGGTNELADHVLDAALTDIDSTKQRRSWWPAWRFAHMNIYAKAAIAAAAVLVVLVAGYQLLPRTDLPGASPTPSPTPVPTPAPTALAMPDGELAAGTYRITNPQFTRRPFLLTVPAGWSHPFTDGNFIQKGDPWEGNGVTFASWIISHVYDNSCQWEGTLREAGTAAALVTTLRGQSGHETSGGGGANLGDTYATRFDFSLAADFEVAACDSSLVRLWPDAGPNEDFGLPIFPGQTTTIFILDPAMVMVSVTNEDSSPADVEELASVMESIKIEP